MKFKHLLQEFHKLQQRVQRLEETLRANGISLPTNSQHQQVRDQDHEPRHRRREGNPEEDNSRRTDDEVDEVDDHGELELDPEPAEPARCKVQTVNESKLQVDQISPTRISHFTSII